MIKLNLGCGNKHLADYINVDKVARGGKSPDVDCYLTDLPFTDNYADEILAVHVVEHFYEWEIDDVLREWIRVLKPGGKLVLECPDLIKACWYMIDAVSKEQEPIPQMTYWPLYGDPGHKDPYMCHRWGWTPQTLGNRLVKLGMVKVEEKDAEFHMKTARDMRIEAYKSAE